DLRGTRDAEDRHRRLRTDARDADEHLEERELLARLESVELLRVLAHDVVGVELHDVARRMARYEHLVPDAAHVDDDVIVRSRDHFAADARDHEMPTTSRSTRFSGHSAPRCWLRRPRHPSLTELSTGRLGADARRGVPTRARGSRRLITSRARRARRTGRGSRTSRRRRWRRRRW